MSDPKLRKYDDIEEEDNHLPNWWLAILFGSMVFGFGYWLAYQTTDALPNPGAVYRADVAELNRKRAVANPTSEEALTLLVSNADAVAEGQKVFSSTCASCHGQNAEGLVGPNLTDKFWLHGAKATEILKSVTEGYAEKGMPGWGKVIGDDKSRKVVAYLVTLKGKDLPGKAPQGEPVD